MTAPSSTLSITESSSPLSSALSRVSGLARRQHRVFEPRSPRALSGVLWLSFKQRPLSCTLLSRVLAHLDHTPPDQTNQQTSNNIRVISQ